MSPHCLDFAAEPIYDKNRSKRMICRCPNFIQGDDSTPIISPALPASTTNTNYVYTAEPFEIDASGNQLPIGNTVYGSGYELVGTASFVDPTETGYLIRKPMGFDEFDDYYYEVDFGTAVSVAISVISTAWSIFTGDVIGLVLSLASLVWTIGDNIVKEDASGYFACREYSWHYRVRANSPYNTTLREATKYRYWWVAYNEKNGEIGFIERNDIADGWLLSNFDLIAAGLGRLPL